MLPLEVRPSDPLAIVSFAAAPSTVAVGEIVFLNVTATGGAPPYTYSYSHLPLGCYNDNASSNGCGVAQAGRFLIEVTVNDTAGASVNATTALTVVTGYGGPPVITSFYADPATASVYQRVLIHGNATSKSTVPTGSLTYLYLDLPPGCASFNATVLECIPTGGGTFHIRLQVSDAFGAFAVTTSWLNITGGSSSTSSAPGSMSTTMWIVLGIVILIILVAVILMLRPGRRSRRPKAARPWSP